MDKGWGRLGGDGAGGDFVSGEGPGAVGVADLVAVAGVVGQACVDETSLFCEYILPLFILHLALLIPQFNFTLGRDVPEHSYSRTSDIRHSHWHVLAGLVFRCD